LELVLGVLDPLFLKVVEGHQCFPSVRWIEARYRSRLSKQVKIAG
jgi:hypothetical protein